jgi:hypothetical protein
MIETAIAIVIALTACATPAATSPHTRAPFPSPPAATVVSNKRYGAPVTSSQARPWKIGQRAVYKRRDKAGVALEQVQIVAQDTCGYWIEYTVQREGGRTWLYCVRRQPAPDDSQLHESLWAVSERRNRKVVFAEDFSAGSGDRTKYVWLVSLVHAPRFGRDDLPHEDVGTPAGQFDGALRVTTTELDVEKTRWSHPAVPLGGIVKEWTAEYERILVDFGTKDRGVSLLVKAIDDLQLAQSGHPEVNVQGPWIAFRVGFDSLGTLRDLNRPDSFGSSYGFPLASALDVAAGFSVIGAASSSTDQTLGETLLLIGGSLRFFPLGRSHAEFLRSKRARIYAQADVSYANQWRSQTDGVETSVARGISVGGRVGIRLAEGRDWMVGIEVHDTLFLLTRGEGLRQSIGAHAYIQLFTRSIN